MRLVILGATGRTGQQVTEQGLARGHSVTAVVRDGSYRGALGLRVIVADPCNPEELRPAFAGQDAVISCLGQRPGGDPQLVSMAAIATLDAMRQVQMRRLVIVSGALLYPSWNPLVLVLKRMMAAKLADGRAAEKVIYASKCDWTIVRPSRLRAGESKGFRIESGERPNLSFGLQFYDLGACLLKVVEEARYVQQILGVASR